MNHACTCCVHGSDPSTCACTCTCMYSIRVYLEFRKICIMKTLVLQYQLTWPVRWAANYSTLLSAVDCVWKYPHPPPKFNSNIPRHLSVRGEHPFPPDHIRFLTFGPLTCWKQASTVAHWGSAFSSFDAFWKTNRLCEGTSGVCLFPPLSWMGE